jgi:hypothetical protein
MSKAIQLPGLRAETLLGFVAALGTLRVIAKEHPDASLRWIEAGGGWAAELHVPGSEFSDADAVADAVFHELDKSKAHHPILRWERFLSKAFADERAFFEASALAGLTESSDDEAFTSMFTSQLPAKQGDALEHFDHPFRAARKDYYLGNLKSVLENTKLDHIVRTIALPWDYSDAMANQSLRLDHGDDRRHAYQWHAPTEDPARQKSGCMLGANRLALEAFPLFPCIPAKGGNTAVGFTCKSKTSTWITWPVWTGPCSIRVIASLLNLTALTQPEPPLAKLRQMGIAAVLQSRRLPIEKNKVFLPPVVTAC